jgi:hypothetical protein
MKVSIDVYIVRLPVSCSLKCGRPAQKVMTKGIVVVGVEVMVSRVNYFWLCRDDPF